MTINASKIQFDYKYTIGNQAVPPAEGFSGPVDVAIAEDNELFVACSYYEYPPARKFIVKCNMDEDYLGYFGSYGEKEGQFIWPNSLAYNCNGSLYLSDEWLNRITVFDTDGNFMFKIDESGSGKGQLNKPAGLDFDPDGNLWICVSGNNRVQKFTSDGEYMYSFGTKGNGPGMFNTPWGIKIDKAGNVFVADWRNSRVQKFNSQGVFLQEFGSKQGEGELNRPSGVAVDNDGLVYIVDWGNEVVKVFDQESNYLQTIKGDCHGFSKWAETRMASDPENMSLERAAVSDFTIEKIFFQPTNIEIDAFGRILIVDCGRHRIQVYEKSTI